MSDTIVHVMGPPESDYTDARFCTEPDAGQSVVFHAKPSHHEGRVYCTICGASPHGFKAKSVLTMPGWNGVATIPEDA